jgi:hypothetical protein
MPEVDAVAVGRLDRETGGCRRSRRFELDRVVRDERDLVQKPVGSLLREAGKHDRARLLDVLARHAATAPRVLVRYASEHLSPDERRHLKQAESRG